MAGVGRFPPLGSSLQNVVMDYRIERRRAFEDGVVDDQEARRLLAIVDPVLAGDDPELTDVLFTLDHLRKLLGARRGMFAESAMRQFREMHQLRGTNVIDFPAMNEGESA